MNDRIRVPEVRLVGPAGEQVGIVRIEDALRLAAESDLDLVEVAPQAKPPVAKLMDFGKYKYEAAVKAREARKNQTNTVLKEIRFRLKIDTHDYETKRGHAMRFLGAGDKVKAMIQFRGREQQRPEMGIRLLQKFAEDVAEVGVVESSPRIDGRNMVMVIGPTKNKAEAKAEARRETQRAEAKAANEAVKAGGEVKRIDTSRASTAPLTQSLADLLPEGYSITSEPETAAPEAPVQEAPAAADVPEAPVAEPTVVPQATEAPAAAPAPKAAPARTSSAPARTSSAPRSTASRPAAERPAASRPAQQAPRPATAAPAPRPAAAPVPRPAAAAPKPSAAPMPSAMPKPGAPKPSATPKPAGRTAPKSPTSRPKPGTED
ncbi:translation initiation factor IF-3 [Arthrobacter sp. IIF3SC--B10]|uniref:Translation initiation factor IF-3 n=1 Tax=Arthrobacter burdickii TaxID=3035920 RepID=A0ABT8K8Y0_9MICC|nr:translation initiation factor IF-3 [Arthrobacter burdickii]MDN4612779.1 translation initiation factor IF-3 [Arthrobacter burdickii]